MVDFHALGATIRSIREARGWKRERLAADANISWRTLVAVELGANSNMKTLSQIARALDIELSELFAKAERVA